MKNVGNWEIFEYLVILWDILEFVDIFAHRNWRKFYDFGRILWLLLIISAVLRFFKILGYLLTSRMFQIKESFGILVIIKTLSGRWSKILEDSWRFLKILVHLSGNSIVWKFSCKSCRAPFCYCRPLFRYYFVIIKYELRLNSVKRISLLKTLLWSIYFCDAYKCWLDPAIKSVKEMNVNEETNWKAPLSLCYGRNVAPIELFRQLNSWKIRDDACCISRWKCWNFQLHNGQL